MVTTEIPNLEARVRFLDGVPFHSGVQPSGCAGLISQLIVGATPHSAPIYQGKGVVVRRSPRTGDIS